MRLDFIFGFILAVAGAALAVALMAAPAYFHIERYAGLFFWGGIALFLLLLIAAIAVAIRDEEAAKKRGQSRPVLAIAGMVVFGLAFIGCAAWYFWPAPKVPQAVASDPLDNTVSFQCERGQIPQKIPAHGYYEFQAHGPSNQLSGGFISSSLAPGSDNSSAVISEDSPRDAVRCILSNFGTAALLNVQTAFRGVYREIEWENSGSRSGKEVGYQDFQSPPQNLLAGDSFEFFVRNYSPYWVDVRPATEAVAQIAGEAEQHKFKLIQSPTAMPSSLVPFIRNVTTDLLSLFVADANRFAPTTIEPIIPTHAPRFYRAVATLSDQSKAVFFYLPRGSQVSFDLLGERFAGLVRLSTLNRVVVFHDFYLADQSMTNFKARHQTKSVPIIEFRGADYVARSLDNMKNGALPPTQKYIVRDGQIVKASP